MQPQKYHNILFQNMYPKILYSHEYSIIHFLTTSFEKILHQKNILSQINSQNNDTIILYLLLDKPSYGYEISKQIKQISEEKYVIKETTLYSAFTRLEKNGYITSFSSSDNANGKRRTYYQITGSGREYYRMKCEEWKLTLDVVSKFIRF